MLQCRRSDYSAGRIAHAIEDCNANVLNLNVVEVTDGEENDDIFVQIRVDRNDVSSIARSLARYGMKVLTDDDSDVTISETERMRALEILRYIDM